MSYLHLGILCSLWHDGMSNGCLCLAPDLDTNAAEGVPERDTKLLIAYARANNKVIIGPATVGGVQVGGDEAISSKEPGRARVHRLQGAACLSLKPMEPMEPAGYIDPTKPTKTRPHRPHRIHRTHGTTLPCNRSAPACDLTS